MTGSYEIICMGSPCGTAVVTEEGLYCRFSCRCQPPEGGMHRLVVRCGDTQTDLGICVPMDGIFGTERHVARKRLGNGNPEFFVVRLNGQAEKTEAEEDANAINTDPAPAAEGEPVEEPKTVERFIPVRPGEPFAYLSQLENAVYEERGDQVGIVLPEE